ncbi:MAG: Magnesium and cobalt efflux protein CorC [Alphaproteobacteria bacterium MarineAlpha2_Bin1]|nr:MAG: Magnesium and cobalt efflux protein CorC [Alphaproteobacteria bacterium MarineAlpha2_Bin1]|tara:strand:- start:384 stop:1670 length:1287 start_codon:yes stop_codon:yes gene_type:complete
METYIILTIIFVLILIIFSAFFSGSETALTAASRPRLTHLEAGGNKKATIVLQLLNLRERLIGSILLGNNLVNIFASSLATSLFITWTGDAGVAYATIVMTALILIFAEVLPKTYALRHPTRSALRVAPILKFIVIVLSPIVISIEAIVGLALRIFGADKQAVAKLVSPQEEIVSAIKLHAQEGGIVKDESDMLRGVFDLSERWVTDAMIHRKNMVMIDGNQDNQKIIEQVLNSQFTRIPIWFEEKENITGVLHAKDLLREIANNTKNINDIDLEKIMLKAWFVPESTTLLEQMTAFRDKHQHFALVVDEYGALMGLITLEDIIEEIVGPITDEYDIAKKGIRRNQDGSFLVDGTVTIRDLNRDLGWNLPHNEAVTVAGLVVHESRSIPEIGQIFNFFDTRFEILKRHRNQITLLKVFPHEKVNNSVR